MTDGDYRGTLLSTKECATHQCDFMLMHPLAARNHVTLMNSVKAKCMCVCVSTRTHKCICAYVCSMSVVICEHSNHYHNYIHPISCILFVKIQTFNNSPNLFACHVI